MIEFKAFFTHIISIIKKPQEIIKLSDKEIHPITYLDLLPLILLIPAGLLVSLVIIGNGVVHLHIISWLKLSVLLLNSYFLLLLTLRKLLCFLAPSLRFTPTPERTMQLVVLAAIPLFIVGGIVFLIPSEEGWWLQPLISGGITFIFLKSAFSELYFATPDQYRYQIIGTISGFLAIGMLLLNYLIFNDF